MSKQEEGFKLALTWLYLSIPMWLMGLATPGFFDGFFWGVIFVPFWGMLSAFVFSLFGDSRRNKRK